MVTACLSGLAHAAGDPTPKLTLIDNVNICDGQNEALRKNAHVLIKNNLIETISDEPLAIIQTDNVTMTDGGGRTLIPGLIDAHWHTMYNFWSVSKVMSVNFSALSIAAAKHSGVTAPLEASHV